MVDEFEEGYSRDKQHKFKLDITNSLNNASTSSRDLKEQVVDSNDRSSIFEAYEKKHSRDTDYRDLDSRSQRPSRYSHNGFAERDSQPTYRDKSNMGYYTQSDRPPSVKMSTVNYDNSRSPDEHRYSSNTERHDSWYRQRGSSYAKSRSDKYDSARNDNETYFDTMSASTSRDSGFNDDFRSRSREFDNYSDDYYSRRYSGDHRSRRPPSGYIGNYQGRNFDPNYHEKRRPRPSHPDDLSTRPSREYENTRTSQYPPQDSQAKRTTTFSPTQTPSSSSPPRKIPDPTKPPFKRETDENWVVTDCEVDKEGKRIKKITKKRINGEGLNGVSDPRKNIERYKRRLDTRRLCVHELLFIKDYPYDNYSIVPQLPTGVCIKGLSPALTEGELNNYFKGLYKSVLKKLTLHYDRRSGVSLGVVWIKFSDGFATENCIKELNGHKDFNLGKAYIGSTPPIQVKADDDGTLFKTVVEDIYKRREEEEKNRVAKRKEEEKKKKESQISKKPSLPQPTQTPKVLPTPSTKIGFNPNQQTPSRPGVRTSWLGSASRPSSLAHTPSHPKPIQMPKAGSEDTEDEDEHEHDEDEIYKGRSDNMLTRKRESPVKKSQQDVATMDEDKKEVVLSIDDKIKKNGNAHIFIDKSSLPVQSVDVVDVRAFFGQFKVTDVLKNDEGWYVLFAKPGVAGRATTTSDGRQCSGFTMHLQLRDPQAQELESHNEIRKDNVKLSDKRVLSEEPIDEPHMVKEEALSKTKRGRVVKSVRRNVDFTSSEEEEEDTHVEFDNIFGESKEKVNKKLSKLKGAATKKKTRKPSRNSIVGKRSQSPAVSTTSTQSTTTASHTVATTVTRTAFSPDIEPLSEPSRPYTEGNPLDTDLIVSEEDKYYLKTVLDRHERKLLSNVETLLQIHAYTPPDWKDDLKFSIYNSPEKASGNAPWRPSVHATGSARSEGVYPIPETEKAFYLPQRNKAAKVSSTKHQDDNKVSSRANRSNARSLAHGLTGGATDSEILKFNQLRTRKKELRFAKSSIHSWGLYSCQVIPKGEMVIEYVGEVVRQQVADRREKAYEKQGIGSSYLFKIDDDNIVDATMKGSVARLINHCCQPNCTAKIITILGEKKIIIYAKTEISPGDEITYDYHFPIEDEKIPCLCGVEGCRGSLN